MTGLRPRLTRERDGDSIGKEESDRVGRAKNLFRPALPEFYFSSKWGIYD
jgi:hypothetical protein